MEINWGMSEGVGKLQGAPQKLKLELFIKILGITTKVEN